VVKFDKTAKREKTKTKLGIGDEVTCFISQYFSINADIA
jgi:hypothetical protein